MADWLLGLTTAAIFALAVWATLASKGAEQRVRKYLEEADNLAGRATGIGKTELNPEEAYDLLLAQARQYQTLTATVTIGKIQLIGSPPQSNIWRLSAIGVIAASTLACLALAYYPTLPR